MTLYELNDREQATVLAALRAYAERVSEIPDDGRFRDLASNAGAFDPLGILEIEALGDRFAAANADYYAIANASAGTPVVCPSCSAEPRGTVERVPGVALVFASSEKRFHYAGDTEVDWNGQQTLEVTGHPIIECTNHHWFTHPDFEVN